MKYTILPPGPEPKRHTASCPEMVYRLRGSNDLTINQKALELIPKPPGTPFMDKVRELMQQRKESHD